MELVSIQILLFDELKSGGGLAILVKFLIKFSIIPDESKEIAYLFSCFWWMHVVYYLGFLMVKV